MGNSSSHESEQATPPRRVLNIDPRSPSGDISRTPIVVQKTPDNVLDNLDPRSPTVGILRTPLAFPAQAKTGLEPVEVPKLDLEGETGEDNTQNVDPVVRPDLLDVTGIENISLDDFPVGESTRLIPYIDEEGTEADKLKIKKLKARSSQPKELFPSKKKSLHLENITRSPLSTRSVNTDSPLQIVQRKQLKDFDIKRSCGLESSTSSRLVAQDKENL